MVTLPVPPAAVKFSGVYVPSGSAVLLSTASVAAARSLEELKVIVLSCQPLLLECAATLITLSSLATANGPNTYCSLPLLSFTTDE